MNFKKWLIRLRDRLRNWWKVEEVAWYEDNISLPTTIDGGVGEIEVRAVKRQYREIKTKVIYCGYLDKIVCYCPLALSGVISYVQAMFYMQSAYTVFASTEMRKENHTEAAKWIACAQSLELIEKIIVVERKKK